MKTKEIAIVGFAVILAGLLGYLWMSPSGAQLAPDVTIETLDGKPVSLTDLRGRPVLVTFWATTCPSCVKEIPHLAELHQELGPAGLAVLGVAMAYDPPEQVRELVERRSLPYTIGRDNDGRVAQAFGNVSVTPTSFLIDPEGRIVQKKLGSLDIPALKARIRGMLTAG